MADYDVNLDGGERLPLGHPFVPPYESPGSLDYPPGTGCAYIIRGAEWGLGDPVRCRKSEKEHRPVNVGAWDSFKGWMKGTFSK